MNRSASRNDSIATGRNRNGSFRLLLVLLLTLFAAGQSLGAEHRAAHLGEGPGCEVCLTASHSASVPADPMPERIVPLVWVGGDVSDGPTIGHGPNTSPPARAPPARGSSIPA